MVKAAMEFLGLATGCGHLGKLPPILLDDPSTLPAASDNPFGCDATRWAVLLD
jgi:hypothetical protein